MCGDGRMVPSLCGESIDAQASNMTEVHVCDVMMTGVV